MTVITETKHKTHDTKGAIYNCYGPDKRQFIVSMLYLLLGLIDDLLKFVNCKFSTQLAAKGVKFC